MGRELSKEIYYLASHNPLKREFAIRDQLIRCSISITANIAEGFERDSNKEFIYFLAIAKGSCGEVRSFLYLLIDTQLIERNTFTRLHQIVHSISKLLSKLIDYLKTSPYKGRRHSKAKSPIHQNRKT